ncbi:hypothetical protein PG985_013092 [Apiospora marii]|uniref:Uncharacterized protein n=1 Tax=Apiospora marii TaxID=335849 RepID=A0ABR1RBY0_9PEZI
MVSLKVIAVLASMGAVVTSLPITRYDSRDVYSDDPNLTIIHGKRPIPTGLLPPRDGSITTVDESHPTNRAVYPDDPNITIIHGKRPIPTGLAPRDDDSRATIIYGNHPADRDAHYDSNDPNITIIHRKRPLPADVHPRNGPSPTPAAVPEFPTGDPLQPSVTSGGDAPPSTTAPSATPTALSTIIRDRMRSCTVVYHAWVRIQIHYCAADRAEVGDG